MDDLTRRCLTISRAQRKDFFRRRRNDTDGIFGTHHQRA
jgi:hypothetical protein